MTNRATRHLIPLLALLSAAAAPATQPVPTQTTRVTFCRDLPSGRLVLLESSTPAEVRADLLFLPAWGDPVTIADYPIPQAIVADLAPGIDTPHILAFVTDDHATTVAVVWTYYTDCFATVLAREPGQPWHPISPPPAAPRPPGPALGTGARSADVHFLPDHRLQIHLTRATGDQATFELHPAHDNTPPAWVPVSR